MSDPASLSLARAELSSLSASLGGLAANEPPILRDARAWIERAVEYLAEDSYAHLRTIGIVYLLRWMARNLSLQHPHGQRAATLAVLHLHTAVADEAKKHRYGPNGIKDLIVHLRNCLMHILYKMDGPYGNQLDSVEAVLALAQSVFVAFEAEPRGENTFHDELEQTLTEAEAYLRTLPEPYTTRDNEAMDDWAPGALFSIAHRTAKRYNLNRNTFINQANTQSL